MSDWTTIDGWFAESDAKVYQELVERIHGGLIIEIGTYKGRSLASIIPIAVRNKNPIICVDSWADPEVHQQFHLNSLENSWATAVWPIRMTSVEAALLLWRAGIRADLIFIDADHQYESVRDDIAAWRPLLYPTGVMAGHDYHASYPGVIQAVSEAFPDHVGPVDDSGSWVSRAGSRL